MSQKRARLRALASFGLSILFLGTVVPPTAAASDVAPATFSSASDPANLPAADVSVVALAAPIAGPAGHSLIPVRAELPVPATVAASARVIALAEKHLGARYAHGATGPHAAQPADP